MNTTTFLHQKSPPTGPRIDQLEKSVREAAKQWGHDLRPSDRDEPAFAPPGTKRLYFAITTGALLATLGLGYFAGSSLYAFFSADPPSPPLQEKFQASIRGSDEETSARFHKTDREAIPREPNGRGTVTSAGRSSRGELSPDAAPQTIPSTSPSSSPARQDKLAARPAQSAVDGRMKTLPVPETRPTTVQGWVVRDVAGRTAILEGPNGVWTATPGATVPEVGKVHFIVRWGERWIVGTSRGLIATR